MNETKIKICGLFREEDIDYVNLYRPDYAGFVFAKSRRQVTAEWVKKARRKLDPQIIPVGVFVDEDPQIVIQLMQAGIIEVAQLHGAETKEMISYIFTQTGKTVIKAIQVRATEDINPWNDSKAEFLLLDSGQGTGKTFDWTCISDVEKPFFLAGGIAPDNVCEAVRQIRPYGIDVSSGVETDNKKDPEKIRELIRRVRNE